MYTLNLQLKKCNLHFERGCLDLAFLNQFNNVMLDLNLIKLSLHQLASFLNA